MAARSAAAREVDERGGVDRLPGMQTAKERQVLWARVGRRVIASVFDGSTLVVLTTSQKLAHRIAHELQKAFGGRARYTWSDKDGALTAVWQPEVKIQAA